ASKYFSVSYVVAAHRVPDCTSPLSNPISSVFCSTAIDTCKKELKVSWNSYSDFPARVEGYELEYRTGGSSPVIIKNIDRTAVSYTLTGFTTGTEYCFVVRAILQGGNVSSSNRSCIVTKMQRPPDWINADYTNVSAEGKINLSFSVDPASEIKLFSLERKTGSTGSFNQVAQLTSSSSTITYTDNGASESAVNTYRLSAINNCSIPVTVSNLASNISMKAEIDGSNIKLNWNLYRQYNGVIEKQVVYADPGTGYSVFRELLPGDTALTAPYSEIMFSAAADKICFYLEADESSNPFGKEGKSISSRACILPVENVTVPNIFTPNDDLLNDEFRPVLSFTPSGYNLTITDRTGKVLFTSQTFTEAWNGRYGGNALPQGVYLWYLSLVTPSGRNISRTGTVTIRTDR
ncbi:MAG: gliding motility-associated C-terminal domain-containing protein, partial [Bacteroidales bacterium]|nr:gliding motility-associated C-terminal domain-containing protein [Bacteroidales bacterium]